MLFQGRKHRIVRIESLHTEVRVDIWWCDCRSDRLVHVMMSSVFTVEVEDATHHDQDTNWIEVVWKR
jgi:hypothetical protein